MNQKQHQIIHFQICLIDFNSFDSDAKKNAQKIPEILFTYLTNIMAQNFPI